MTWAEAYEQFGHKYWSDLVTQTKSNISEMARISKVNRTTVYKSMDRFNVSHTLHKNGHRGCWELYGL